MNLIGCGRDGISSHAFPSGRRVRTEARVSVFEPIPLKPPATTYTYKRLDCWNWQALRLCTESKKAAVKYINLWLSRKFGNHPEIPRQFWNYSSKIFFARASLINICLQLLFLSGLTPVGVVGRIAHAWALLFDGSFGSSSTKPSKLYLQVECIS